MIDISGTKIIIQAGALSRELDLNKLFLIDDTDLIREFSQQASLFAYFSTLAADAERDVSFATMIVDQEAASVDHDYRAFNSENDVKITESMVRHAISDDARYQKLSKIMINKKYHHKVLKAVADALEQRANMLVSLGAYLRHEMDMTGMNIRRRELDGSVDNLKNTIKKIHRENDEST